MKHVHFVLAANNSSSQTRITVEYANQLVRRGFQVTVSVSRFDFYDFAVWRLSREARRRGRAAAAWIWARELALPMLRELASPRPWFGRTGYALDPRVQVNRYLCSPNPRNMPGADAVVAFQCYLLAHLLRLPPEKGKVVSSIRLDYRAGTADPVEEVARWGEYCNGFFRDAKVPFFAVSRRAMESARAMGAPVETVIQNGINVEEFRDGGRRGQVRPLRITAFTNEHPQKGQDFGCAVIRKVRGALSGRPGIEICSVGGNVKPEYRGLFDRHYGYLTGTEYARMFRETDIFLFPSRYEGFPAVPLEAMASGCALVTTWVSGVEEYAQHGRNCMTRLPGEVEPMAGDILTLVSDTSLRDSLREGGIRTARGYSWETAADKLITFLETHVALTRPAVTAPSASIGHWVPHKEAAL